MKKHFKINAKKLLSSPTSTNSCVNNSIIYVFNWRLGQRHPLTVLYTIICESTTTLSVRHILTDFRCLFFKFYSSSKMCFFIGANSFHNVYEYYPKITKRNFTPISVMNWRQSIYVPFIQFIYTSLYKFGSFILCILFS